MDATFRGDLRELNELNFGRFGAKMELRLAEIRLEMDRRFAELRAHMDKRFAESRAFSTTAINQAKESMLRWMIGLWLTQMLAFAGLWFSRG